MDTMDMRALIVDDEDVGRNTLKRLLQQYARAIHRIDEAKNTEEARRTILRDAPDIIFLDIEMPHESGLQFLHSLHPTHRLFAIIIVTGHSRYIHLVQQDKVFAFLLKPIDIDELQRVLERVEAAYKKHSSTTTLHAEQQITPTTSIIPVPLLLNKNIVQFIEIEDILYCEIEGNYCRFHLNNDESILACRPFASYQKILTNSTCLRIHRSHIVNPRYITRYIQDATYHTGGEIELYNGTKLPVARRKKEKVRQYINTLTQCT